MYGFLSPSYSLNRWNRHDERASNCSDDNIGDMSGFDTIWVYWRIGKGARFCRPIEHDRDGQMIILTDKFHHSGTAGSPKRVQT